MFEFPIVGESFYQVALERLAGPKIPEGVEKAFTAVLVCETNNPHDANAVAVQINGSVVGHLSRADARTYRAELMRANGHLIPISCAAVVTGGWRRANGDEGSFGVQLDMFDPPEFE